MVIKKIFQEFDNEYGDHTAMKQFLAQSLIKVLKDLKYQDGEAGRYDISGLALNRKVDKAIAEIEQEME